MSIDGPVGVKSNATASGAGSSGGGSSSRPERGVSPSPSAGSDKQLTEKELRVKHIFNKVTLHR
jgi:hypothetical protein